MVGNELTGDLKEDGMADSKVKGRKWSRMVRKEGQEGTEGASIKEIF